MESFAYYLTATFLLSYLTRNKPDMRPIALGAITAASIIAIFTTFIAGSLTDRIGRRPIYRLRVPDVPAHQRRRARPDHHSLHLRHRHHSRFSHRVQGSLLTEQFRTATRASGASLGYQLAATLGGFAPFIAGALVFWFGWPGAPLLYIGAAIVGLIAILSTKETYGPAERNRINTLVAAEKEAQVR